MMSALLKRISQVILRAAYPDRCHVCQKFRNANKAHAYAASLKQPPGGQQALQCAATAGGDRAESPAVDYQAWNFGNVMRPFVCDACRSTFTPIKSPLCIRCGMMFTSRVGLNHLCGVCLSKPGQFTKARAVGVYDQVLMAVVHHLKYQAKIQLARPLGRCLFSQFMRHWAGQAIDMIVPVPLHPLRLRQRGFNQAYLLIKDWPELAGACGSDPAAIRIAPEVLKRRGRTVPQSGLGRKQRQANIHKSMIAANAAYIQGKHVLVVDDVLTTGATANECARALVDAGAKRVDLLTLARVL